jgi:hypothetical protein
MFKHVYKVHIGKYLTDVFPVQSVLKEGDFLTLLLFIFALEYVSVKDQEHREGLHPNKTQISGLCS